METLETLDETLGNDRISTNTHLEIITWAKQPSMIVVGNQYSHDICCAHVWSTMAWEMMKKHCIIKVNVYIELRNDKETSHDIFGVAY